MATKNTKQVVESIVAVLLVVLLAAVAVVKLTSKDVYGVSATMFQTARMALYAAGAVLAVVGLAAFAAAGFAKGKAPSSALTYGLFSLACFCMVFVHAFSIAGEFENQGKALQGAMYAVVYLMLAATMYIMCAMEAKPIFRVIVIVVSLLIFAAATATDFSYLMAKACRITGETESIVACALYADKIAVLAVGVMATLHEIVGAAAAKTSAVIVEETKEGE